MILVTEVQYPTDKRLPRELSLKRPNPNGVLIPRVTCFMRAKNRISEDMHDDPGVILLAARNAFLRDNVEQSAHLSLKLFPSGV